VLSEKEQAVVAAAVWIVYPVVPLPNVFFPPHLALFGFVLVAPIPLVAFGQPLFSSHISCRLLSTTSYNICLLCWMGTRDAACGGEGSISTSSPSKAPLGTGACTRAEATIIRTTAELGTHGGAGACTVEATVIGTIAELGTDGGAGACTGAEATVIGTLAKLRTAGGAVELTAVGIIGADGA
jgi:hypothetical protein